MSKKKETDKEKALTIFRSHLIALDQINERNDGNIWKDGVRESLKIYLGVESSFIQTLDDYSFTESVRKQSNEDSWISKPYSYEYVYSSNKKENFKKLINQIIQHVTNHGTIDSEKITRKFPWTIILSIGIPALFGLLTAAYFIGKEIAEKNKSIEYYNLKIENKNLSDTAAKQKHIIFIKSKTIDSLSHINKQLEQQIKCIGKH